MAADTTSVLHAALHRMLAGRGEAAGRPLKHWNDKNRKNAVFSFPARDKLGLVSYAGPHAYKLDKDRELEIWDRYPKSQRLDVEATLDAITAGLLERVSLAPADGTTRAKLEMYVRDVLECPQPLSVEIVAYLRIAASRSEEVFMGDGGEDELDPDIVRSLNTMYCVETAEDAAGEVAGTLDSFFSEFVHYDDPCDPCEPAGYARGTNLDAALEEEVENDMCELGELITEPARDFLPAAEIAYCRRKQAEEDAAFEAAFDAKEVGAVVVDEDDDDTKEGDIEPTAFALLCKEIGQDFKTDLVIDDRALKVLYDASVHFVEGLMGAASRIASRRGRDAEASVDDVAVATPACLKLRKADCGWGQKRRVRREPMPARLVCQPELPPGV